MKSISRTLQQLQEMFGPRVVFGRLERMFHSHDVGALPSLVKFLIGSTMPAGIVQPLTEEQVIQLWESRFPCPKPCRSRCPT